MGRDGGVVGEEELALGAEGAERGVAVVVGLEEELDLEDRGGVDDGAEQRLDAAVAAEAVDALPGRQVPGRDEALGLELAVGEEVLARHGEEVRLALEAVALVELGAAEARVLQHPAVVGLLAGPGGEQVRQVEELLLPGLLRVDLGLEAGVGGVHEARLRRVRRHHQDAHAEVEEPVAQAVPLADGEGAVDAAPRAPAGAGVRVGAALHAEVGGVAHQHRATPAQGSGIPGGRAGWAPSAFSRCAWGTVQ